MPRRQPLEADRLMIRRDEKTLGHLLRDTWPTVFGICPFSFKLSNLAEISSAWPLQTSDVEVSPDDSCRVGLRSPDERRVDGSAWKNSILEVSEVLSF